jgi:hypothetical protein
MCPENTDLCQQVRYSMPRSRWIIRENTSLNEPTVRSIERARKNLIECTISIYLSHGQRQVDTIFLVN